MYMPTTKGSITNIAMASLIGTSCLFVSHPLLAEDGSSALYLGAAFGYSRVDNEEFKDNNSVLKAFAGIKPFSFLGVEAAINDFGTSKNSGSSAELTGSSLAVVGFLPLSDQLELFAKMGNLWWDNKITVFDTFSDSSSGNESFYGAGVNLFLSESMAIRFELERYDVKLSENEAGVAFDRNFDFDVASVGINFNL